MAQFDVYRNPRGGIYALVVDVQADVMAQLETRVVAPLVVRDRYPQPVLARATPTASIAGVEYIVVVPMLAAISRSALTKPIGSLKARRADLVVALDLLLTGS